MAVRLADATAYLSTNDDGLRAGLDAGKQSVSGWGSAVNGLLMGAGMAAFNAIAGAAQAAVGYLGDSVGAASNLGETTSKVNTLFGEQAASVLAWANTSAEAYGLSKQAALDAVGGIGNMFLQLGAGADQAAAVGQGMVQLSADIASFHNVAGGSTEVLDAMSAAFRGEYDTLQRYIPTINAAAVEQQALAMTGKESAKELTNLEKALAVQALTMRDAGAAVGDFARTSQGAANQERILAAQMDNLQATVGEALLPIWTALISLLNELVQAVLPPLSDFIRQQVVPAMAQMAQMIDQVVGPALAALMGNFGAAGGGVEGFTNGPFAGFVRTVQTMLPQVQAAFQRFVDAVSAFWRMWGDEIMAVVGTAMEWTSRYMGTMMQTIIDIVTLALQLLTGDWEAAGSTLQGILQRWQLFVGDAFRAIVQGVQDIWHSIDWGGIGRAMVEGIGNGIRNAAGWLRDAAWDAAMSALEAARNALGIHSPSAVAAQQIGQPFAEGIGVGMRESMAALAGDVNAGLRGLMGGVAMPTAAGAPISITINVSGGNDPPGIGLASRDGVLAGLRAAGLR